MNFPTNVPVNITLLGAGGTGGHAAPHLYRLLRSLGRPARLTVCDGDLVEEKNLARQNFIAQDLGRNKARVLAERYAGALGMETCYVPEYVECEERLAELVRPEKTSPGREAEKTLSLLIGCVDNNRSRRMCHGVFTASDSLVYVDSGNGESTGQVVCGIRQGGKTVFPPVGELYPDVLEETDRFPSELSCAEAAVSAPQSIAANVLAAAAITSFAYGILVLGKLETGSASFSAASLNMRAARRP